MLPHADSEYSDQTGQMPRLIRVFAGRTGQFVSFVMRRLICLKIMFAALTSFTQDLALTGTCLVTLEICI